MSDVPTRAKWLRDQRRALGWSAERVAEETVKLAETFGDRFGLTQQAVSAFETGKTKSEPRWLRYTSAAFLTADMPDIDARAYLAELHRRGDLGVEPDDLRIAQQLRSLSPQRANMIRELIETPAYIDAVTELVRRQSEHAAAGNLGLAPSLAKSERVQFVSLPVVLPAEAALVQVFRGLLDTPGRRKVDADDLARELAMLLPSALQQASQPLEYVDQGIDDDFPELDEGLAPIGPEPRRERRK